MSIKDIKEFRSELPEWVTTKAHEVYVMTECLQRSDELSAEQAVSLADARMRRLLELGDFLVWGLAQQAVAEEASR